MKQTLAKRLVLVLWDLGAWAMAFAAFLAVRRDLTLTDRGWSYVIGYTLLAMALQVIGGFALHLYLGRSRVGSFDEVSTLGVLVTGISVALGGAAFLLLPFFSRGVAVGMPVLALALMVAGRAAFRIWRSDHSAPAAGAPRVIVYGAGDVGHQVAHLVAISGDPPYRIVGYVDDDPGKRFLRVHGHRVIGTGRDVVDLAQARDVRMIILAITAVSSTVLGQLSDRCRATGISLVVVPPVREMIGGRVELTQLREVNVTDLLGRRPVETDLSAIAHYITGRSVLITGAGGSIGSELAQQVHKLGPSRLVLLDRDESALHGAQLAIYGSGLLERDDLVLCDIRDHAALCEVFSTHRPDVVFHAAALKHLPMLERFPVEGWKTNVLGSLNVLRCSAQTGVRQFVNVSTDKAADATSVLGQTKRIAERLTAWFAQETGRPYLSVRFGNVLGSRGSVLFAFKAQVERGGPVTVTHPEATRYFMTIPEACELVLQSGAIGGAGEVLVLDMGEPIRIMDIARRLVEEAGGGVEIVISGLRPGEKLHEVLFSTAEERDATRHPLIDQVSVRPLDPLAVLVDEATTATIAPYLRTLATPPSEGTGLAVPPPQRSTPGLAGRPGESP